MDTNLKIGIVSLGLIGGSIFKALRKYYPDILCVSKNKETVELIKKTGSNASHDLNDLKDRDIVFVCSPMRNVLEILDKLETIVSQKTIVADVSSLKAFVCVKERPYIFIPTHPMAGKETSGFNESEETLFKSAKWILTPLENTLEKDINSLKEVIEKTGADVVFSTPQSHDNAVALISHMPLVLSQALIKSVEKNELAMKLASSGFRDMTRLALSNTIMAQDMVEMNFQNIKQALDLVIENGNKLINNYNNSSIEEIKNVRNQIYSDKRENIFK